MDLVQTLFDWWDEGEEGSYPDSKRVPATAADLATFEATHGIVLPNLAKDFYRRVNGMTQAEWEQDTNHFCVRFFALQRVTPVECPSAAPGGAPLPGRYFAIAAIGHWDPGPEGFSLVYAMELFKDRTTPNPVRGIYTGHRSFHVAASLEEFFSTAATLTNDHASLNPEWAAYLEGLRHTQAASRLK